jgi:hypothetical protein
MDVRLAECRCDQMRGGQPLHVSRGITAAAVAVRCGERHASCLGGSVPVQGANWLSIEGAGRGGGLQEKQQEHAINSETDDGEVFGILQLVQYCFLVLF